jgi:hypothetical protein
MSLRWPSIVGARGGVRKAQVEAPDALASRRDRRCAAAFDRVARSVKQALVKKVLALSRFSTETPRPEMPPAPCKGIAS